MGTRRERNPRDPGDPHVAHLGMDEPVKPVAARERSAADAGPDRDVDDGVTAGARAPPPLTEHGAVDVGVDAYRQVEPPTERARDVDAAPPGLGRVGDEAGGRRCWIEIQRPEAGDPEAGKGRVRLKEVNGAHEGLGRVGGGKTGIRTKVVGPRPDRADDLAPADFYAARRVRATGSRHAQTPDDEARGATRG